MKEPPETYNITVTVSNGYGGKLTVNMPEIPRDKILSPAYPSKGITAAVKLFEMTIYGTQDDAP